TGRVRNVTALADGRLDADLELLGHGNFDLRVFPRGAEHAHAFDLALGPDNRQLLLARILAGLRQVRVLRELMSFAEQRLHMFLREMNVMRGNLDEKRLLLLGLEYFRDVRSA